MNLSTYKNIIFDLGGVILNIEFQKTFEAFARLGNIDLQSTIKKFKDLQVFENYEKGDHDNNGLFDLIRKEFNNPALTNDEISAAWNAMLLDLPQNRLDLIQSLSPKYRVFLLSNTNEIHIKKVEEILKTTTGISRLADLFEKVYLSYEIGMIKPGKEIYEYVLQDKNLNPAETLFLDDNADNIAGAQETGITAIQVTQQNSILEILKHA